MLFLLDANVLIDANRDYYPLMRIPEYWEWLLHKGSRGEVKIALEVYEEVKAGTDDLAQWMKELETESALLLNEDVSVALVGKVTSEGYAPDLNDVEVEKIGRDPFLIAYGVADAQNRCIVSTEASKPGT